MADNGQTHILYADRPEWKDLKPVPQHDTLSPMAPIFYSTEYQDAADYFRAIVQAQERSQRALEITEHLIRLNPSHYTVWRYRYETLLELKADLAAELEFMNDVAIRHLKSYQVWHHRRLLLTQLGTPGRELAFIARVLRDDSKNYHTWAYREWVLAHFNQNDLWAGELEFVEKLLDEDLRNNSAWHHRFFVVWDSGVREGDEDREAVLRREINYVKDIIAKAPNNPSAWSYLNGILEKTSTPLATLQDFVLPYTLPQAPAMPKSLSISGTSTPMLDLDNPTPSKQASLPCPYAMEFLADIYEEKYAETKDEAYKTKAIELFKSLAEEHDTMRKAYWEFRQRDCGNDAEE
jgi:protein farnesyltransferase/geranylgeranyltransferase type-1 subunit alpha